MRVHLRLAWRQVQRNRLFSAMVILLLATGIGANTLVFGLVNELLLKPLPVRDPGNLYLLEKNREKQVRPDADFDYPDFRDVIQKSSLCAAAVAEQEPFLDGTLVPLAGSSPARLVTTQIVSPNYFTELGVEAVTGRVLTPADAAAAGAIPVVLSYQFWQSQFAGDRAVIGRTIRLKGAPFLVAGVLPREFHSSDIDRAPDVRAPISAARVLGGSDLTAHRDPHEGSFRVLVRLARGVSPAHAAAALVAPLRAAAEAGAVAWEAGQAKPRAAADLRREIEFASNFRVALEPIGRGVSRLRDQFARSLCLLLGGVAVLLLAVCANISGLLLARSDARRRDMGIRLAVGAGRPQLIGQLLTESLVLAGPGAALGALLAYAAAPLLLGLLPPPRDYGQFQSPQLLTVTPDYRLLLFTAALPLLCLLAFGLVPALRATRVDLAAEIKSGGRRGRSGSTPIAPLALQAGFSVVLLAGAGVMLRTFWNLDHAAAGFDRAHIVEFTLDPQDAGYDAARRGVFFRELARRTAELPGVHSVAYAARGIMRGVGIKTTLAPEGVVLPRGTFLNTSLNEVTPAYFETMGIRLLAGRNLEQADAQGKPVPILVNEAFAGFFFPRGEAIGRRMSRPEETQPGNEIVGMVATSKYRSMREADPPTFYSVLDLSQDAPGLLLLYVRTSGRPASIISAVRGELARLDPAVPLVEVFTLEQEIQSSLWQERLVALLAGFFGAVSLLLAGIGSFGSLTYAITQRAHELSIRVAVGARARHIAGTVCYPMAAAVVCGLAGGGILAALLLRLAQGLLYGVRAADPLCFAAAAVLVLVFAAAASAAPVRRAVSVDAARALRGE